MSADRAAAPEPSASPRGDSRRDAGRGFAGTKRGVGRCGQRWSLRGSLWPRVSQARPARAPPPPGAQEGVVAASCVPVTGSRTLGVSVRVWGVTTLPACLSCDVGPLPLDSGTGWNAPVRRLSLQPTNRGPGARSAATPAWASPPSPWCWPRGSGRPSLPRSCSAYTSDAGEVVQSSRRQTGQTVVMATKTDHALSDITDTDTRPPSSSHDHRAPSWALHVGWQHRAILRRGR